MFKGKKLIAIVVLAVVIVAGSLGGIVLAQTDDGNGSDIGAKVAAKAEAMWTRVAEIYKDKTGNDLDTQALKDSMSQAREEQQKQAMQDRLEQMVQNGKLTQEQADKMQQWMESRPTDIPFKSFSFSGRAPMRGFPMMRGFGDNCPPPPAATE